MALYIECEHLTEEEKQARHNLIYLFNPCLKSIFNQSPKFQEYAFNSCRQTAIFGATFLLKELRGYHMDVYEGKFNDVFYGKSMDYEHAFIVAHKDDRNLLIDVSRTTRHFLFHTVRNIMYPKLMDYINCTLTSYEKLDWFSLLLSTEPEYITGKLPVDVMTEANQKYDILKSKRKSEQLSFAHKIYDTTTDLGGEFI